MIVRISCKKPMELQADCMDCSHAGSSRSYISVHIQLGYVVYLYAKCVPRGIRVMWFTQ